MRNAQELSLNMIVVGALALLVLLIIGGVLVFGGSDLIKGLTGLAPSSGEVSTTTLLANCRSSCNTLNLQMQSNSTWWTGGFAVTNTDPRIAQIKAFCCAYSDLNKDGLLTANELCVSAYPQCSVTGISPVTFCRKPATGVAIYDFSQPGSGAGSATTCPGTP